MLAPPQCRRSLVEVIAFPFVADEWSFKVVNEPSLQESEKKHFSRI